MPKPVFEVDSVAVLSLGVGGVIMRKFGTETVCPLVAAAVLICMLLLRYERLEAILGLRLALRGTGIEV